MNWYLLARKDFDDVVRSRLMWAAIGLFVLLMGIIGIAFQTVEEPTFEMFVDLFAQLGAWLMLPLIAIMIGYMAIVGERQSGSLRVLFGLSLSRGDVMAGKLVSRLIAMAVVTVVTLVVGLVLTLVVIGSIEVGTFAIFAGFTIILAMMFTAIALASSAIASTRYRAMGLAVGSYVMFALLWHPIVAGIHYIVEGALPPYHAPEWYFLLTRLNPLEAYNQVVSVLIDQYVWGMIGWVNVVEDHDVEFESAEQLLLTNRVEGELPFYLSDWFAVVIILLWIAIPLAIGYRRFVRADLN